MTNRLNEGAEAYGPTPRASGDEFDDWEDLHRNPMIEGIRADTRTAAAEQGSHPSFFDDGEGNFKGQRNS